MPRAEPERFHKPIVLVVEGTDDCNFLIGLLADMGIESVQIMKLDGFPNMRGRLDLYPRVDGFDGVTRLGILVDSDDDPSGRVDSIRDSLRATKFGAAVTPLLFSGTVPNTLYSMLPSHDVAGCLEDLLIPALRATDSGRATCVDAYLTCAGFAPLPRSSKWSKAWVHSYFSSSENPGLKIGEATKAGMIDLKSPALDVLRAFLNQLTS